MLQIKEMPVTRIIDHQDSVLVEPFKFYSGVIASFCDNPEDGWCEIPTGFVFDWESEFIFRGTNPVASLPHDYFSRKDSVPIVTKKIAADVYLEFMKHRIPERLKRIDVGKVKNFALKADMYVRAYIKYCIVLAAPGYFHKKTVLGVN